MKKLTLLLLLVMGCFAVQAQSYTIDTESHDFGTFTEGESASHEFKITNTGTEPLLISGVRPSCGCTTPFWTKTPIMPGKTGSIKALYNTKGRPGPFNKSLTVTTNGEPANSVLRIRGTVEKNPELMYTKEQLDNSAVIALDRTVYKAGKLETGQKTPARFTIKNTGKTPLEITNVMSDCRCTTFEMSKPAVAPGESAILTITYMPRNTGQKSERISISSNDLRHAETTVTIEAEVVENVASEGLMRQAPQEVPFK